MDLFTRELDLHSMSVAEARKYLKSELNAMPKHIKEVRVIHGYRSGKELQTFIRKEFSHKRIEKKMLELNQGMTTFILK
jgi:DNA-nicking Smr family endonuclease